MNNGVTSPDHAPLALRNDSAVDLSTDVDLIENDRDVKPTDFRQCCECLGKTAATGVVH